MAIWSSATRSRSHSTYRPPDALSGHRGRPLRRVRARLVSTPATPKLSAGELGLAHGREQIATGLLTAAANLRADAAVVMVGGVPLALLGARTTGDHARLERGADDSDVGFGLTGQHSADAVADIGAVEIEPDAPDELRHVRLAKAGVG